jgi:multiple sugar transport system permease protein
MAQITRQRTMATSVPAPRTSSWVRRAFGPDWKVALPFVLPLIILLTGLIAFPVFKAIQLSFTTRQLTDAEHFVGIQNYKDLLHDKFFKDAISNSVVFTAYSEVFKVTAGLIAAMLLHNLKRGRAVLTALVLLPWIVPTVVTALAWRSIFDPLFGGLNTILLRAHLAPVLVHLRLVDRVPASWLGQSDLAMPSVILVNVWKGIPFFTLNLLAGLKAIDNDLYEAASVDGANSWQKFLNVTLPGLRYVMLVTTLLSTIWTFNTFDVIYLLTGGGPGNSTQPYVIFAYNKAIAGLQFGPGAAVALMMVPFLGIFIFILARYMRQSEQSVQQKSVVDLGTYSRAALYAGIAFVVAILVSFGIRNESIAYAIRLAAGVVFVVFLIRLAIGAIAVGLRRAGVIGVGTPITTFFDKYGTKVLIYGLAAILAIALFKLNSGMFIRAACILAVILALGFSFGYISAWLADLGEARRRAQGRARARSQKEAPNVFGRLPAWIGMAIVLFLVLAPFYWIIITAFKSELQVTTQTSVLWPKPWTLAQFHKLTGEHPFWTWFRNSAIVAIAATVLSVCFAALAGYALARLRFRGAQTLTGIVLMTYLVPGALLFIPLYRILSAIHLINSLWALIITYPTFALPFATWLLMGYFRGIPEELENAAMIDGATRFQAFRRVTLPLATPALMAVALFTFTNAFNEFLLAFVFITPEKLKTLPVGLQSMIFGDIYPWGQLMAGALIMAVPVVIVYALGQRFLVEGLTAGSVKG